jgi:CsoR family transcriptional regulator, copper-sensing transcriptional repressor
MTKPAEQPVTTEQLHARLRRIEGQVRGIARMLDTNRSCEDVVTQLMAVRSSLDTVGALVLDGHLGKCLGQGDPEDQVAALRDAMRLWWRFAPSAGGMGAAPDEVGAYSPLPELTGLPEAETPISPSRPNPTARPDILGG